MSTRPNRSMVRAMSAATCASTPTSQITGSASAPDERISVAIFSNEPELRPVTTTRAPRLARSSAVAAPIPVPPPVTMATLPVRFVMCGTPQYIGHDFFRGLVGRPVLGIDEDFGMLRRLIRGINPGEVLQLAGPGFLVQTLYVALFRNEIGRAHV